MMMWASDLPSGLPADVLAQLLAGRLALVPAKIRYAQPHEWTGVTPESRLRFWPVMYRQKWGHSRPRCGFLCAPIRTPAWPFLTNPEQLSPEINRTGCRTSY